MPLQSLENLCGKLPIFVNVDMTPKQKFPPVN